MAEPMTDSQRAITTEAVVKKCFTIRRALSGMAKGGWLGSGMKAAQMQTGGDRIAIGKNYLSYAQKFAKFGRMIMRGGLLSTRYALLKNTVRHAGKKRVLSANGIATAKNQAVLAVVKWYKKANKKKITV
jgi:hypothetical protein